jgi:hypothetical protein
VCARARWRMYVGTNVCLRMRSCAREGSEFASRCRSATVDRSANRSPTRVRLVRCVRSTPAQMCPSPWVGKMWASASRPAGEPCAHCRAARACRGNAQPHDAGGSARCLSLAQLQAAADYREAFVEAVARHVQAVRDGWMDESDWRIALRSPSTDSALLSRQLTRRLRTDACAQPRRAPPSSE